MERPITYSIYAAHSQTSETTSSLLSRIPLWENLTPLLDTHGCAYTNDLCFLFLRFDLLGLLLAQALVGLDTHLVFSLL